MSDLFDLKPLVIGVLHMGNLDKTNSMAWREDFLAQNMAVYEQGGISAVMIQDGTPNAALARPETITVMASLAHFARKEFPAIQLGIIFRAHDPYAPLAVAHACDASFVRIKVFVGSMMKAEGIQEACGTLAVDYRHKLGSENIQILADVFDRTGYPVVNVPIDVAAQWAVKTGADSLVLTGFTFDESLRYHDQVHQAGVDRPLLLGGSVNEANIAQALQHANGVIVSTSLRRSVISPDDMVQWDLDKIRRFMDVARSAAR
jgi:uncharacterized protein